MDQYLLHQPMEEMLLLGSRAPGHDPFEVFDEGDQHLPVAGQELQPLPPGLEVALLGVQLLQTGTNQIVTRRERIGLLRKITGHARNRRFSFEPTCGYLKIRRSISDETRNLS